jgi:hypothetical protein
MRSDRDWVEQVQQDPASVLSNLGILVTPKELAQLQRQQASLDDYSALIAYGIRHADQFGGLYIDQPAGTTVTLTATPAAGSSLTSFAGCTPGANNTCTVVMTSVKTVTATFQTP